jgi:hypothetical protein
VSTEDSALVYRQGVELMDIQGHITVIHPHRKADGASYVWRLRATIHQTDVPVVQGTHHGFAKHQALA